MILIFFTSLIVMCHYRNRMNPKVWNLAFIGADAVVYFCWTYAGYEKGWLKDVSSLTFENISPLLCTVVLFTLIMNDKVKRAAYSTLAAFSVGLFMALMISPEHAYLFKFNIEANFVYTSEAACHLVVALFGSYLVISGQVKPDFRSWVRSIIFTYSLIGYGVFANYLFHKTYFGLNPYGSSSIYMIDIFHSHEATLFAYLAGVLVVLTLGMQVMYVFNLLLEKLNKDTADEPADESKDEAAEPESNTDDKRVYLFDLDGTLVDSMPTFGAMIIATCEAEGIEYPEDVVRIATPLGYRGSCEYFKSLGAVRASDDILTDMYSRAVLEYEQSIPAKAGVAETLSALKKRGASLNVLTASPHEMLDPCLKRLGLYELFDNVWSCEDFSTTKADPKIYSAAAERLGVSTEEIVFVDDNKGAIETALSAGVKVYGIYDDSSCEMVNDIKSIANGYVYNFRELLDM